MGVDLKDVELVARELGEKFDEFKSTNDKRLEAIEAEKTKLSETTESLNGKLSELDKLKQDLEAALKEQGRPKVAGEKDISEHRKAFGLFVRKGKDDGLRDLERKALQTTTDEDGGYAVPEELDRNIQELLRDAVVMRQECRVITVGTPAYKKLVNRGGTSSGWVGETEARPETNASKLAQIEPVWGEIYANPQATQTMLDDVFFDAEAWIASEVQEEFSEQEEAAFTVGDGTKKPKGYLAYGTEAAGDATRTFQTLQHLEAAAPAALDADELVTLVHTLRKVYRGGAKWMMNNMTLLAVRLLKDPEGNYLWRPGLEHDKPSTLLGYGIAENEAMADIGAGEIPLSFGDFKRGYTILDRIGTRVLRDPYTNKPFVGFYTTKRVGGMLSDYKAIKVLKMAAA
ncbi:phage major capsid protein [Alloalcanivorax xenomutans]